MQQRLLDRVGKFQESVVDSFLVPLSKLKLLQANEASLTMEQTTEGEIARKQRQEAGTAEVSEEEEVLYKIEIPANRYDMLCLEGIARALNTFLGRIPPATYKLADLPGMLRTAVSAVAHIMASSKLMLPCSRALSTLFLLIDPARGLAPGPG